MARQTCARPASPSKKQQRLSMRSVPPRLRGESRKPINDEGQQFGRLCSFPAQPVQHDITSLPVSWARRVNLFAVRIAATHGTRIQLPTYHHRRCPLAAKPHMHRQHSRILNRIRKRHIHIRHPATRPIHRPVTRHIRKHPAHQHLRPSNRQHQPSNQPRRHQNLRQKKPVTSIQWQH